MQTLEENFGIKVEDYVQIKFDDFKKVIDILGGVSIDMSEAEINYVNKKLHVEDADYENDILSEPGVITLN